MNDLTDLIGVEEETNELTITRKIDSVLIELERIEIENNDQFTIAGNWLRKNKETQKIVKDFYEPERKKTHEAYKLITVKISSFTKKLENGERIVKSKISAYQMEQERKIQKERQERLAEQARIEEKERKKSKPSLFGNKTTIKESPAIIEPEPTEEVKVEGVSFVSKWVFEIEDPDKIPREYLIINEKKIREVVTALKSDTQIPGVKVKEIKESRIRT